MSPVPNAAAVSLAMADLAIIGGGPRGISVLERIVARHGHKNGSELHILLIDPHPPGAGKVWRTQQPGELLMNTMSADNTVFPDTSVRLASPVGTGPTFLEWLRHIAAHGHRNTECSDFARTSTPRDYAPRRVYGEYLRDALETLRTDAPEHLRITEVPATAQRLVESGGGYRIRLNTGEDVMAHAVVLATGHLDVPQAVTAGRLPGPRPAAGPRWLPGGHPTDYQLGDIEPGAHVLLRGGGLNAYDVLALLTAGRGGRFTADDGYLPSGREPRLWITTRRGVPFHARVDTPGVRAPVAHLTPTALTELAGRKHLDFRADVLPLLHADLEHAWYERLFATSGTTAPEGALAGDLPSLRAAAPPDQRLDLAAVAAPLRGARFDSADALQEWFVQHLAADLAAATDPRVPPAAALAIAIRQARPALTRLITSGNLTGESYRRDILGHLNGFANFLSAGPPVRRVRELRALVRAGVVRLLGPTTPTPDGSFASTVVPGLTVAPEVVVDAWMPPVDVTSPGPGIIRDLVTRGVGRPHTLPSQDPAGAALATGALDTRASDGRVRCPGGGVHDALFAVGVPLEGVRWTTAIGARPGTDSAFFHETDQVAAEVLTHLGTLPQEILP